MEAPIDTEIVRQIDSKEAKISSYRRGLDKPTATIEDYPSLAQIGIGHYDDQMDSVCLLMTDH